MRKGWMMMILLVTMVAGCQQAMSEEAGEGRYAKNESGNLREAVFAGGCFWCTESDFEKVDGVIEVISGYTGGHVRNPSYEEVSGGGTGHVEAINVRYNPEKVTYEQLLDIFWRHVDPTDAGGQFVDRGNQYRSVIFYADEHQKRQAEASKKRLAESGRFNRPVITEILPLGPFYPAEDYHQDYYRTHPVRYTWYRYRSGRDQFLETVWGGERSGSASAEKAVAESEKPSEEKGNTEDSAKASAAGPAGRYTVPGDEELRRRLTPLQYRVTRESATEPPFDNAYWDNHEAGIYVDIISGEPLFSSKDKYDSGTGWPSFTRPLVPENIVERTDTGFFTVRTEIRSRHGDSHLGHVFNDGPEPTGLRYCMNSAALRFIPAADLEKEGYGEFRHLFE